MGKRNPKWHRDEIILALDLYFSNARGSINSSNPKIQELSELLNSLPLFPNRPDAKRFRNENGVALKLGNFLSFDPKYNGVGMKGGSTLDKIVFDEFKDDLTRLHNIANQIKLIASNKDLKLEISLVEDDELTIADSVSEGQILYKVHKIRERDAKIINRKKEQILDLTGKLACEACVFEFEPYYGKLGKGFIECHHKIPLYSLEVERTTRLDDLSLVCSNCHRMLHRKSNISVEDLRLMIKYDRA